MAEKEFRKTDRDNRQVDITYDEEIDEAIKARNTQFNDSNPMLEKEGFLGMDDLDRLRRRKTY